MVGGDLEHGRRRFLGRVVATVQTAIGGTLAVIFGGAATAPALAGRQPQWLPASPLGNLPLDTPTPVVVGVPRRDGYTEIIEQRMVFLVRSGTDVTALDSTCTHLGCRVSWDVEGQELRCPCHGGVFDKTGAVKAGPPPAPLARVPTRVDGAQVLVHL
jgi:Rieske Fe-S protein